MKPYLFLTLLLSVFITGCALVPTPQNVEEFKSAILKSGYGVKHESYTVKRPYLEVVKTIKAKSKQCLNKKIESTSCGGIYGQGCLKKIYDFNPTFIKGKNKSELHLQVGISNHNFIAGEPPKGGLYVTVIEFLKSGKKNTKITVYSDDTAFSSVPEVIKKWANRTNLGCPDLTKVL